MMRGVWAVMRFSPGRCRALSRQEKKKRLRRGGLLPFDVEEVLGRTRFTGFSGLPLLAEAFGGSGAAEAIERGSDGVDPPRAGRVADQARNAPGPGDAVRSAHGAGASEVGAGHVRPLARRACAVLKRRAHRSPPWRSSPCNKRPQGQYAPRAPRRVLRLRHPLPPPGRKPTASPHRRPTASQPTSPSALTPHPSP